MKIEIVKTVANGWYAYDYDNYEPGLPVGYGDTAMGAIEDLLNKIEDEKEKEIHRRGIDTTGNKVFNR